MKKEKTLKRREKSLQRKSLPERKPQVVVYEDVIIPFAEVDAALEDLFLQEEVLKIRLLALKKVHIDFDYLI